MPNYAYLRVSTDRQDVENQKHGILDYGCFCTTPKKVYFEVQPPLLVLAFSLVLR